jgi:hypothetical protein
MLKLHDNHTIWGKLHKLKSTPMNAQWPYHKSDWDVLSMSLMLMALCWCIFKYEFLQAYEPVKVLSNTHIQKAIATCIHHAFNFDKYEAEPLHRVFFLFYAKAQADLKKENNNTKHYCHNLQKRRTHKARNKYLKTYQKLLKIRKYINNSPCWPPLYHKS